MGKFFIIFSLFITIVLSGCNSNSAYPDEIERAYNYVSPVSQETIKDWKKANVEKFTPTGKLEVKDEKKDRYINIEGLKTLKVTFKTTDDAELGPINVYIDEVSKKILGIGIRK
ncbi:hypothetical protein [Fictibacillus barbaricus]|uniref:Uncharacterized protein n=1 Tax=Fictibacillus barbaricus TaxID=182136 RepID=A0ABU1U5D5_9BACL|nr:hypothetical protein [Fictibacillus barbaricus]MDR7074672.1 hypothetical protein [Fictibacillus barbaricus]